MVAVAMHSTRSYAMLGALLAMGSFGCSSDDAGGSAAGGGAGTAGKGGTSGGGGSGGGSAGSGTGASAGSGATAGTGASAGTGGGAGASACAGLKGEGYAVGQIAENWTLKDRNGANVNLHDYCGQAIYIEDGAEW